MGLSTVGPSALIGRAAELAEIATVVREGRSVLVHGARGTGRSAVLAQAARQFAAQDGQVLATRPLPGDGRLPGAALQRLFAPTQARTRALSDPARAAFAALLEGTGPVTAGPLTAAVAELAALLAGDGHWLWVVDDLDQLDDVSCRVLAEAVAVPMLAAALPSLPRSRFHPVRLGGLRPADAAELVRRTPGARSHFGRRLVLAQAAGNPLALAELGRHLGPEAAIPPTTTELAVPDRLRRTLAPVVDHLDPVRLQAALLAAVAVETPGPATRAALDRLIPADVGSALAGDGVLRPGRARRFTHPMIRAAVIERAGFAQSHDARRQLAALLPEGEAARAWHLARADPAPDEPIAARLEQAGRTLSGAGRLRAATYAFAMAAGRSPEFAVAAARRAQAAHTAHLAGELAWAGRLSAEPQPGAAARPEPVSTPELAPLLRVAWIRGDDVSRGEVRDLLGTGRPVDPALLGIWARAIVEDPERDDEIQRVLHEYDRGRRADGLSPDQRAMVLGTIALARHETALAIRHLGRALAEAPPGGLHRPMALGGLAWAHFDTGDLDAAESAAEQALAAGPADMLTPVIEDLRVGALVTLAAVALLRAGPTSDDRLHEALDAVQPDRHAVHHLRLERIRGIADERDGRSELAYRRLRRLYDDDGRPVHHRISDLGLADLAHVAVTIGAAGEVAPIVAAAEHRVRTLRSTRVSAAWHRARALLAGTDPAAESWHRLALADPGGDQWPLERALTRFDYAQWLRRRQRPGESRPLLAAAGKVFEAAELTSWSARAAAELEAAAPPRRRGRAADAELTPQQQQVVTLAAQGLTNQQIATRLALSARTVGTHLSRAYAILGISRRSQLPSAVDPA